MFNYAFLIFTLISQTESAPLFNNFERRSISGYQYYQTVVTSCTAFGFGPYNPEMWVVAIETNLTAYVILDGDYESITDAIDKCKSAYPIGTKVNVYMSSTQSGKQGWEQTHGESAMTNLIIGVSVGGFVIVVICIYLLIGVCSSKENYETLS